jgi:uncharacterized protein
MTVLIRFLLIAIVLFFVARLVWRFVYSVAEGAATPRRGGAAPGVRMVRDPVCGTFVVQSRALTSGSGDDMHYFCSEKCRQAYISR